MILLATPNTNEIEEVLQTSGGGRGPASGGIDKQKAKKKSTGIEAQAKKSARCRCFGACSWEKQHFQLGFSDLNF